MPELDAAGKGDGLLLGQILAQVERDSDDDDQALCHVGVGGLDAQELQDDLEDLEHQHADEDAGDLADAAVDGDAADGAARDGFKLPALRGDGDGVAGLAGADYVGAEELVAKIQGENWFEFDVVVATPNMMGVVGRLGRVLGPKGLMPNPKSGTVTMDVAKAIAEIKAGKVEYRLDKQAIIHCPIGKKSFTAEQLTENLATLIGAINRAKPAAAKGVYMKSIVLSSTMGPGVKVNPLKF